jgi:N-acetylglutamate synthase-like GNAT family acetyltransferase
LLRYVRAAAEDQARIEQFLALFVDDYLSREVSRYLTYKTGGLYLALDDDAIVGTAVIALPKSHEAYLGGMRIRPDVQGKGIGHEFTAFQLKEAERLGARVVRALVARGNDLARNILQNDFGFHVVDEWVVGSVEGFQVPPYVNDIAGPAWAIDRPRLLTFYNRHPEELWATPDHWMPRSLGFEDIWARVEAGEAVVAPQDGDQDLDSLALYHIQEHEMHLNYLRTMGAHLKALVEYLWVEARAWGVKTLTFGLPRAAADKLKEAANVPVSGEWRGLVLEKHLGLSARPVPS